MPDPIFLGEWGNLTNGDHIFAGDPRAATRVLLAVLEAAGASHAYWHFQWIPTSSSDWFRCSFFQHPTRLCWAARCQPATLLTPRRASSPVHDWKTRPSRPPACSTSRRAPTPAATASSWRRPGPLTASSRPGPPPTTGFTTLDPFHRPARACRACSGKTSYGPIYAKYAETGTKWSTRYQKRDKY